MRARPAQIDASKVLLPERVAIHRYLLWKHYRRRERDGRETDLTFAEWLAQSRVEILPFEWPEEAGERGFPFDVSHCVRPG
jgi:hypothetical protein